MYASRHARNRSLPIPCASSSSSSSSFLLLPERSSLLFSSLFLSFLLFLPSFLPLLPPSFLPVLFLPAKITGFPRSFDARPSCQRDHVSRRVPRPPHGIIDRSIISRQIFFSFLFHGSFGRKRRIGGTEAKEEGGREGEERNRWDGIVETDRCGRGAVHGSARRE